MSVLTSRCHGIALAVGSRPVDTTSLERSSIRDVDGQLADRIAPFRKPLIASLLPPGTTLEYIHEYTLSDGSRERIIARFLAY